MTAATATGKAATAVLDVVMLVDESASETPAKVADEKATAGTIVQTMLNPASRVTVIGFGGVNNVVPDQSAVDVVCPPTIASPAEQDSLASCVRKLHRRTEQEGDDTDYNAALGQAMSYFNPDTAYGKQSPAGANKVILMMTDGAVDVSRNIQQYGSNWMLGEQQAVSQQLAQARQDGVQVWPLGFGTDITSQAASYLDTLAKGGAQTACDTRQVSEPHYQVVNNPSDAVSAVDTLYAEAGCLGIVDPPPVRAGSGVLQVQIPAIASAAAISVDRGSPGIQVIFDMPGGQEWTDPSAISGQDSPVEVLHLPEITSAETGTWKIQLKAPPALASQLVRAAVFWQGAVRAVITADPPSAKLGQPIGVTLSVLGPDGPVTDTSALHNLQVVVSVSGDGVTGTAPVTVAPSASAGPGVYKGTYPAPQQEGSLTFTGSVSGYGLYATKMPATVQVGTFTQGFTASVQPPIVKTVQVGQAIQGQVNFVNQTGSPKAVRLQLTLSHVLAAITGPAKLTARSGGPSSAPFMITFDKDSPTGPAWVEIKAVDATQPDLVYSDVTMNLTVKKPPGFLARYFWVIIGILALIVLAVLAVLWARAAHRRRVDVRGLIAILRRNGEQMGGELKAPGKWAETFRFIIRDEDPKTVMLDYPQTGFPPYTTRRAGNGEVRLMTPGGERYDIVVGGPGETIEGTGLELAFRDTRRGRAVPQAAVKPRGGARSRPGSTPVNGANGSGPPPDDQEEIITSSPAPTERDEWL